MKRWMCKHCNVELIADLPTQWCVRCGAVMEFVEVER